MDPNVVQKMPEEKGNYFVIGAVVIVALLVGAYFLLVDGQPEEQVPDLPDIQTVDIAAEVSETSLNPAGEIPEANPFGASTNPFDSYKNPFE